MSYEKLRKLYEAGKTLHELAQDFEVSPMCIYNRLKKTGVTMRGRGVGNASITKEEQVARRDRIIQLRAQGFSQTQIAKIVGVSRSVVRNYLKNPKPLQTLNPAFSPP